MDQGEDAGRCNTAAQGQAHAVPDQGIHVGEVVGSLCMNEAIRERLGKAAHSIWRAQGAEGDNLPTFEETPEPFREYFMDMGEAAVLSFAELFMPVIKNMLSEDEIKRLLKSLE